MNGGGIRRIVRMTDTSTVKNNEIGRHVTKIIFSENIGERSHLSQK